MLLALAWLPDFQSDAAGSGLAIQAVLLAIYLFGFVLFASARIGGRVRIAGLTALASLGACYLAVGTISGLAHNDSIYALLRNALGVIVYLSSSWATAKLAIEADPARLRAFLSAICLPYAVAAYLIYNANSGGIDFERVRYQIIGASSMAALGLAVTFAIFRLSTLQLATILINFAILLLSVTRTFLIVMLAEAAIVLAGLRHFVARRLLAAGFGITAIAGGTLVLASSQIARWQARLGGAGGSDIVRDQTFFTRLSEWQFMYDSWTGTLRSFLFGSGFGAHTQYFETRELGGRAQFMVGFGHNQHLSMLFNGGIVGGLPLLVLMFVFGVQAARFLRNAARARRPESDVLFLGAWGATIVIGVLVSDFFAASFILRGQALWYGIGTGLLLGVQARFDLENAWRYAAPRSG